MKKLKITKDHLSFDFDRLNKQLVEIMKLRIEVRKGKE